MSIVHRVTRALVLVVIPLLAAFATGQLMAAAHASPDSTNQVGAISAATVFVVSAGLTLRSRRDRRVGVHR